MDKLVFISVFLTIYLGLMAALGGAASWVLIFGGSRS